MKIAFAWVLVAGMCGAAMAQEADDKAQIDESKAIVTQGFKDPASAQFRNVSVIQRSGGKVVCGEVNAKNSYGGYVGFRRFSQPVGSKVYTIQDGGLAGDLVPLICRPSE